MQRPPFVVAKSLIKLQVRDKRKYALFGATSGQCRPGGSRDKGWPILKKASMHLSEGMQKLAFSFIWQPLLFL